MSIARILLGVLEEDTPAGGGSSPSVISTAVSRTGSSSGTNHAVTLPTLVVGRLLVVFASFGRATAGAVTLSEATGKWTFSHSGTDNSNYRSAVIYRLVDGTATSPPTIVSSPHAFSARLLYELDLPNGDFQISSWDTTDGNGPPNHSPTGGNVERLWIAASFYTFAESGATFTEPTNYNTALVERSETNSASAGKNTTATATRLLTATSEDPGAFGYSGGTGVQMNAITVSGR